MTTYPGKAPVLYLPALLFLFLQPHPAISQPDPAYRKKTDPKVVFDSSLMNKAGGLEFKVASFMPRPLKFSIGDYTMNAVFFEQKVLSDSQVNKGRFDPLGAVISSAASGKNINDYKSRKFDSRSASEYRFDFELTGYNRIIKVKSHAARYFEATGKTATHGNESPAVSYSKLIDTIRVSSAIQSFTDSLSWMLELQLVENDSTPIVKPLQPPQPWCLACGGIKQMTKGNNLYEIYHLYAGPVDAVFLYPR